MNDYKKILHPRKNKKKRERGGAKGRKKRRKKMEKKGIHVVFTVLTPPVWFIRYKRGLHRIRYKLLTQVVQFCRSTVVKKVLKHLKLESLHVRKNPATIPIQITAERLVKKFYLKIFAPPLYVFAVVVNPYRV